MRRILLGAPFLKACALGLGALVTLWAFVSHLAPAFSGEIVAEILRCN